MTACPEVAERDVGVAEGGRQRCKGAGHAAGRQTEFGAQCDVADPLERDRAIRRPIRDRGGTHWSVGPLIAGDVENRDRRHRRRDDGEQPQPRRWSTKTSGHDVEVSAIDRRTDKASRHCRSPSSQSMPSDDDSPAGGGRPAWCCALAHMGTGGRSRPLLCMDTGAPTVIGSPGAGTGCWSPQGRWRSSFRPSGAGIGSPSRRST
jgi:hypothetical protein